LDAGLQPVITKAREINALSKLCFDFLPPGLARLIRAVNLRDRQLILLAASPTAAAKLKMLNEPPRTFPADQGAEVKQAAVGVQPGSGPAGDVPARQPARLSRGALAALQALYRRLPDSPARGALKTLLDHHVKR